MPCCPLQEIKDALDRADQHEVDMRNQRIKRAIDLSSKKAYLSDDMQAQQTPLAFYVSVRISLPAASSCPTLLEVHPRFKPSNMPSPVPSSSVLPCPWPSISMI